MHPDDSHPPLLSHLVGLGGDPEAAVFEVRMRHANGEWRTIDWNAADLLDDPSVNGYVLNGGDVTEARQAAEDLVAARDAALVASRTKSQFVSTMSHEIRTPMNGVIGLTELLLQTDLDDEQAELASGVKVSAESLLVIINDILDFSKIEAGKLDIEESALDVPGVVDDVGRILAGTAHAKGIELLVDVHPDVPSALLGDGTRIQQVLLNFGANAVKFTSEGEVVIRVKVLHKNSERVALRFDVVDTGIGIAPEDQRASVQRLRPGRLLDDPPVRRHRAGLDHLPPAGGAHGRPARAHQCPGRGFDVLVRAVAPPGRTMRRRPTGAGIRGRSRASVPWSSTTTRPTAGSCASSCSRGASRRSRRPTGSRRSSSRSRRAQDGRAFDLGVVDLNMPGMDGIELARALKTEPATAETMLFLLSSSGHRLAPAESHLTGFAASLTKPVRSSELFDCLITSLNSGSASEAAGEPDH